MTWLLGYNYRKLIPVSARGDGSLTNYQMRLTVYSGDGSDSAGTIYLNDSGSNFPGDIRFTLSGSDTTTGLRYFFESGGNNPLEAWINIPTINDSTVQYYYIYYGSSNASTTSSGQQTFKWFYDWETDTTGDWSQIVRPTNSDTTNYIATNITSDDHPPFRMLSRFNFSAQTTVDGDTVGTYIGFGADTSAFNTLREFSFLVYNRASVDYQFEDWHLGWRFGVRSGGANYHTGGPDGNNLWRQVWATKDEWYILDMYCNIGSTTFTSGHVYSGSSRNVVFESGMADIAPTSHAEYHWLKEAAGSEQFTYYFQSEGWDSRKFVNWGALGNTSPYADTWVRQKWHALSSYIYPEPEWDSTSWGEFEESGAAGPPPADEWITYSTMVGSPTSWSWKSGQDNTDNAPTATSSEPTTWEWAVVSTSASYFYPSGNPNKWLWSVGNA